MAFLREGAAAPQHFYRVGDTLPGGGVLREVYRSRIVFGRDGRTEELTFPEHRLQLAPPPTLRAVESAGAYIPAFDGSSGVEGISGNRQPSDFVGGKPPPDAEQASVIEPPVR
jgi:hypothetical protein